MTKTEPTLHLLCGKAASGKSTLAARLGSVPGSAVISEDAWLAELYGDQMTSLKDFARCSERLQSVIGPHVVTLLKAGLSVVLDFHANTVARRAWMRGIIRDSSANHILHILDVPDAVCLARIHERKAGGDHPFALTEEQFKKLATHFFPPTDAEGFRIERHGWDTDTRR